MPISKARTLRLVLAVIFMISAFVPPVSAEPLSALDLKNGELQRLTHAAANNARVAFIVHSGASAERAEMLQTLVQDRTREGFQALAEIASVTADVKVRAEALSALASSRPNSDEALAYLLEFPPTKTTRLAVQTLLKKAVTAASADQAPADDSTGSLLPASVKELSLLQSFAQGRTGGDLTSALTAKTDLENGSRYFIQSLFLKKILSLQSKTVADRERQLTNLMNEIDVYLHKPAQTIKIQSQADLDAFKKSVVSQYAMLADEMKFSKGLRALQPVRLQVSSKIKPDLEKFSKAYRLADRELEGLQTGYFFDLLSDTSLAGVLFRLQLKSLPVSLKENILGKISDEFKKKHESLQTIAQDLVKTGAIKFSNPAEQRFFELMITNYFSTYSFEETANVLKAAIERPDLASGNDLFRSFVMYAGPQMQKLLQVVGRRQGLSAELGKTFQALEDAGLKSPWEKVSLNFKKPPVGYEWVSLERIPRVGSMAETYKGVVRNLETGEKIEIAARTLKSDIRGRVEKEIPRLVNLGRELDNDALLRSYHFPQVGPVMSDVMSMAQAELDVQDTEANQIKGERIYTGKKKISGGKTLNFITAKTLKSQHPDVIYSTWLKGEKFEDFAHKNPQRAIEVSESLAKHWLDNALFNERFFHADLHQGNLKIRQEANGDVTVGILDFGMVGSIEKEERSILIRLSLATKQNKKASLIAKYLYALSDKNENRISESALAQKALKHMAETPAEELTMEMWMAWGMSVGLKLPKKITAFGRGMGAIEMLLESTGSKRSVIDLMRDVAIWHAVELSPDLARYVRDSVKATFTERKLTGLRCENAFAPN
jgi:ABC1 atypical kinase-like domain